MASRYFLRVGFLFAVSLCSFFVVLAQRGVESQNDAKGAVASIEARLVSATDTHKRYMLLKDLPSAALAAGELEKAESSARELLRIGEEIDLNSRYKGSTLSHTTHLGNTILGLVEAKRGNIREAKEYLLASARFVRIPHPVHASFGPSMALARVLLEQGEKDAVVEYFDLCSSFWKRDDGRLERWGNIVKSGGTPDFGGNASYVVDEWRYSR